MAGYFEWMESFSVHVPAVDSDHKVLISLVNEVVTAISEHHGREVMRDTLTRLVEYTAYHFDREEHIMAEWRFPELEQHRAQHNLLIRKVLNYLRMYRQNELEPVELGEFLIDWLTTHILHEDMKLGEHIRLMSVA